MWHELSYNEIMTLERDSPLHKILWEYFETVKYNFWAGTDCRVWMNDKKNHSHSYKHTSKTQRLINRNFSLFYKFSSEFHYKLIIIDIG